MNIWFTTLQDLTFEIFITSIAFLIATVTTTSLFKGVNFLYHKLTKSKEQ